MKTPEEIQVLAHKFVSKDGNFTKNQLNQMTWGFAERGFIEGYSKCQEDNSNKKYTEEDLIKAKISVYDKYTEWNEEVASDARRCIERLNESLNK